MIAVLNNVAVGNAISIFLAPPTGVEFWRVIRNETGSFGNQNDDVLIYEGSDKLIIDTAAIENNVTYFYTPFYWNGTVWLRGNTKSLASQFLIFDRSTDVLSLVRDRLDRGLNNFITRGDLAHASGQVNVLIASPQIEGVDFPIVTVHLESDNDQERFINDDAFADIENKDGTVTATTGYLSNVTLEIVSRHLNADERNEYRDAIKAVLIGNIEVFESKSLSEIRYQFQDSEEFERYPAPFYFSRCTMACLAPSAIVDTAKAIEDIVTETEAVFQI